MPAVRRPQLREVPPPPAAPADVGTVAGTGVPFASPAANPVRARDLTGAGIIERLFRTAPVGDSRLMEGIAEKKRLAVEVLLAAMKL